MQRVFRRFALAVVAGVGLLVPLACGESRNRGGGGAAGGACGTVYLEGVEDAFALVGDLSAPGSAPSIVFDATVPGAPGNQILLTRELVLTLPAEFAFAGFDAAGGGAPIATWDFDFSNPGNGSFDPIGSAWDYRIPIFAIDADRAYADSLLNAAYDAGIDPLATHALGIAGSHVFTVVLPSGGTDNGGFDPDDPCSYFDTDTRFTLAPGVLTLPAVAGLYEITVQATSVDPDTGDADDQQGSPPSVYQRTFLVAVPEPAATLGGTLAVVTLAWQRRRASALSARTPPARA